jgi:DNA (cytosine-5)-methyltransferase 1
LKVKIIFNINLSRSVFHRATHFARWVSKRRNMNHASIFSGIGGAEVAASMMGWQNLFHCEIQEFPRKVLDYWFPNSISYEDITKTDFHQWHGKVDVLTGGFPCQPFSLAGRRKGADDNRYLWPQMLRAIRQIHPTWVVGENVAGIKTMVEPVQEIKMGRTDDLFEENHIYREESRFTLDKICADLEAEGYSVQPIVIPACSVGAPHRRDRVWIVAHTQCDGYSSQGHGNQRAREKKSKEGQDRPQPGVRRHGSSKTSSYANSHRQRRRANKQKSITECCRSSNLGTRRSKRLVSHPYCNGDKTLQPSERTDRLSGFPLSPHSIGFGWKESKHEDAISQKTQQGECQPSGADSSQSRWRNFPSQSPVCRGNDGIPFDVDSLTISFPKWRQESIKAYGNAWVPQVAYEIFRAIEAEENNK